MAAVLERARAEAASLDGYAAERLLSEVRQALEEAPALPVVYLPPGGPVGCGPGGRLAGDLAFGRSNRSSVVAGGSQWRGGAAEGRGTPCGPSTRTFPTREGEIAMDATIDRPEGPYWATGASTCPADRPPARQPLPTLRLAPGSGPAGCSIRGARRPPMRRRLGRPGPRFRADLGRAGGDDLHPRLARAHPEVLAACPSGTTPLRRWEVEARLLAGQADGEIADRVGVGPGSSRPTRPCSTTSASPGLLRLDRGPSRSAPACTRGSTPATSR